MSEWVEKELRSNFARAIRAGHRAANTEPRAIRVRYRAREAPLRIELAKGATITLPVKLIRSLSRVAPASDRRRYPEDVGSGRRASHSAS